MPAGDLAYYPAHSSATLARHNSSSNNNNPNQRSFSDVDFGAQQQQRFGHPRTQMPSYRVRCKLMVFREPNKAGVTHTTVNLIPQPCLADWLSVELNKIGVIGLE